MNCANSAIILIVSGLLAGCLTSQETSGGRESAIPDDQIRKELLLAKGRAWKDPDSIRDASIGHAYRCRDGDSCLCVETNAKNSFGGYAGLKRNVLVWNAGNFQHMRDQDFGDQCDNLTQYPELNGGYVAPASSKRKT